MLNTASYTNTSAAGLSPQATSYKLPNCNLFYSRNFFHFHQSKFMKTKASRLSNLQAATAYKAQGI